MRLKAATKKCMFNWFNPDQGEPNFYKIALKYPLPEDPEAESNTDNQRALNHREDNHYEEIASDSSKGWSYQEPTQHPREAYINKPVGHRQKRYSYPPDGCNNSNPPGYHPNVLGHPANGYGHYLPPYHSPYNYHRDTYGQSNTNHHHNPYISPERHLSVQKHYGYNEHPWHQGQYPFDMHNSRAGGEYNDVTTASLVQNPCGYNEHPWNRGRYPYDTHNSSARAASHQPTAASYAGMFHYEHERISSQHQTAYSNHRHEHFRPLVIQQDSIAAAIGINPDARGHWDQPAYEPAKRKSTKFVISSRGLKSEADFEQGKLHGSESFIDERKPPAKDELSSANVAQEISMPSVVAQGSRGERADSLADVYEFWLNEANEKV
jgi:hypothetical protein